MLAKALKQLKTYIASPLIRNMIIVGGVSLLIKVIAFYKETLIAGTFGLSELLDTFFIAILVPSFIQSVFISSLKNIFIPNYITEIKQGGNKGNFQSLIFLITFGISLFSVLIAYLSTDVFLDVIFPGHTESYYALIKKQLFVVLPCLFFWGLSSVLSGLLEIADKFFLSTISTLFSLATMIFFLIFLKDSLGDMVLALGTLVGGILSFVYNLIIGIKYGGLKLGKPELNDNARLMIKQLPPKISSSFLTAMNNFVDQFFAAQLVVGSIAAINYGVKIPAFLVGILILALGNVLLPHFSRQINEDLMKAYHELFRILKLIFLGTLAITVVVFIFSTDIISFLFERNEFDAEDSVIVGNVQRIMFVYVPFYICTLILVKFLTSINKNKFMAWTSFINLILNVVLNFILVKKYGLYGLAMSTTVVYIISSLIYFFYTYKQYKLSSSTIQT